MAPVPHARWREVEEPLVAMAAPVAHGIVQMGRHHLSTRMHAGLHAHAPACMYMPVHVHVHV